jgi:hypothetical protein
MALSAKDINSAAKARSKAAKDEVNSVKRVAQERKNIQEIEAQIRDILQNETKLDGKLTKSAKTKIKLLKEEKTVIKDNWMLLGEIETSYASQMDTIKKITQSSRKALQIDGQRAKLEAQAAAIAKLRQQGEDATADIMQDIMDSNLSIIGLKKKSQFLSFDEEEILSQIEDAESEIVRLKEEGGDAAKKAAAAMEEDLKSTKKLVKEAKSLSDEVKATKAATDKVKEAAGGLLDSMESTKLVVMGMMDALKKHPILVMVAAAMALVKVFTMINDKRKELQEGMGVTRETSWQMGKDLAMVGGELAAIGADAIAIAGELGDSFGDLSQITPELVKDVGYMSKGLSISTATSATLVKSFQDVAGLTSEGAVDMIKYGAAMAVANKVAPGKVMEDIAENTEAFADYGKDGGKNIMKAAVAARKLGMSLSTTAKIADSLLDFESSIEKEMEASMLIGKQLNFNKARELALSGDIAGAAADVMKQVGGQAEFEKMNVIQRRALADSIGVSTEELSKMTSGKGMKFDKMEVEEPSTEHFDNLDASMKASKLMMDNLLSGENLLKVAIGALTIAVIANTVAQALGIFGKGGGKGLKKLLGIGGKSKGPGMIAKGLNKLNPMNWGKKIGKTGLAKGSSKGFISKGLGFASKGIKGIGGKALAMGGGLLAGGKGLLSKGAGFLGKGLGAAKGLAGKVGGKVAAKGLGKGLGKSLLKKIPGIGLIAGLGFAASRLMKGDGLGALGELASGAASLIPGIGTAASVAIDAALIAKDISKASKEAANVSAEVAEDAKTAIEEVGDKTTDMVQNIPKVVETPTAVKQEEMVVKAQTGKEMRAELDKELSDLNKGQVETLQKALASGFFEPFLEKMLTTLPQKISETMDPIVKNQLVQSQEYLETLQKVAANTGKTTTEIANLTV